MAITKKVSYRTLFALYLFTKSTFILLIEEREGRKNKAIVEKSILNNTKSVTQTR